jgi:hypothetical protein
LSSARAAPQTPVHPRGPRLGQRFPLDTMQRARAIDKPGPDAGGGGSHGRRFSERRIFALLLGGFVPASSQQLAPRRVPALPSPFRATCGVGLRPERTESHRVPLGRIGIVPTSLFPESSGCMAENHPRCVQRADSDAFRATRHDKQGLTANTSGAPYDGVELDFSAYLQVAEPLNYAKRPRRAMAGPFRVVAPPIAARRTLTESVSALRKTLV